MIDIQNVIEGLTNGRGRGALEMMLGATNFIKDDCSFKFKFKGCHNYNAVVIKYNNATDLYDMEFGKLSSRTNPAYKILKKIESVYIEELKHVFENTTHLYTTL